MVRSRSLFLKLLHRLNDERFGIFDLLHHDPNIHGGKLRLPGTATVNAVLADERERVGQHVKSGCETASNAAHLKVVTFSSLTIVVEHMSSSGEVLIEPFGHVDQRFCSKTNRAGFVVLPILFANERACDIEVSPRRAVRHKLLQEQAGG